MEEGEALARWRHDGIGAADPPLDPDRCSRQFSAFGKIVEVAKPDAPGARQAPARGGVRPTGPDESDAGDDSQRTGDEDDDGESRVVHDRLVARCSLTGAEVCGTSAVSEDAETVRPTRHEDRRRRLHR
jgi:hypothetical protein